MIEEVERPAVVADLAGGRVEAEPGGRGQGRSRDRARAGDVVDRALGGVLRVGIGLRNLVGDEERRQGRAIGLGGRDVGHGDHGHVVLARDLNSYGSPAQRPVT